VPLGSAYLTTSNNEIPLQSLRIGANVVNVRRAKRRNPAGPIAGSLLTGLLDGTGVRGAGGLIPSHSINNPIKHTLAHGSR
jgi:hypothetical protein